MPQQKENPLVKGQGFILINFGFGDTIFLKVKIL
jgi:hypothetical protein